MSLDNVDVQTILDCIQSVVRSKAAKFIGGPVDVREMTNVLSEALKPIFGSAEMGPLEVGDDGSVSGTIYLPGWMAVRVDESLLEGRLDLLLRYPEMYPGVFLSFGDAL